MQARLQTLPSSQMHYLIGFLHDHGWLHIGNSWGELLADDHVEDANPFPFPLPPPTSNASLPVGAPFVRVMVKSKVQWLVGLGILFVASFYWIAIVKHNSSPL